MSDHTPGPWEDIINDEGELWVVIDNGDHDIFIGDMEDTCGECHANAQLIAASPDLLAVCEALVNVADGKGDLERDYWKAVEMARTAIAKAKGESNV